MDRRVVATLDELAGLHSIQTSGQSVRGRTWLDGCECLVSYAEKSEKSHLSVKVDSDNQAMFSRPNGTPYRPGVPQYTRAE